MTSRRAPTWPGWRPLIAVLVASGIGSGASAAAAEAHALGLPSALPPLTVGVDSVTGSLRIDLQPGAASGRVHPDLRLLLTMPLPLQGALLRVGTVTLSRVRSDQGEYLAVVTRPFLHDQHYTADSPANRERVLSIACAISPPFQPCNRLLGLHGSVQVVLAQGATAAALVSARIGAAASCAELGEASIVERTAHGWQLRIPDALADRLDAVVGVDAAGVELLSRSHAVNLPGGGTATEVDCDLAACAALRISWWPQTESRMITVDLPEIDVPGGLPTIGGMALPPQSAAPVAPDSLGAHDALDVAVVHGDRSEVERLLAAGAPLDGVQPDGPTPLVHAVMLGDAAMVAALLAHHPALTRPPTTPATLLGAGVTTGSLPVLQLLLASGLDPYAAGADGRSAVDQALALERWQALRLLVGNPGSPAATK